MHSLSTSFILGYHGCDETTAKRLLAGEAFSRSTNNYDWLGHGIYFWEANPKRGFEFAQELARVRRGKSRIKTPAVVGAVISLGRCLDLTTSSGIEMVRTSYDVLQELFRKSGSRDLPENNADRLRRNLDCAVVNLVHDILEVRGDPPIMAVQY